MPDTGGADLFWTARAIGEWHDGLDHATFDFAFNRQLSGPVEAYLYFDGKLAHHEVILDRRAVRSMQRASRWGGAIVLTSTTLLADQLHRARTASVILAGPGSRRIAEVQLPMPDWEVVDRLVAEAIPALDDDARNRERHCERESGPEI